MIEKNIFQSWYTKSLHPLLHIKISKFLEINPDYKYHLYTDNEMDDFVKENYPGEIYECYSRLNIIVAKVDFWRYLVLYKYGGVYLDMDSSIDRPLNGLIKPDDDAIITAEGNPNMFVQWALIFRSNHPILKKTIELVVENITKNSYPNDIHKMTGPTVFSRAVNAVHRDMFGVGLDHSKINKNTDTTYSKNAEGSYRIYGVDYSGYFTFKHEVSNFMYQNKKHWRQEQTEKPLLN